MHCFYFFRVLHEHMNKLSKVITPNHKDLRIPKMYCYECPWPSAQADVAAISAYKTPRDKLRCVFRCCTTIMNLLSLASDRSVPAADDLVPVLVFVLIKVWLYYYLNIYKLFFEPTCGYFVISCGRSLKSVSFDNI